MSHLMNNQPIEPKSSLSRGMMIGFALALLSLIGVFALIFEGYLTLDTLTILESFDSGIFLVIFIVVIPRLIKRKNQLKNGQPLETEPNLINTKGTINFMMGVSYFFIGIIILFIVLPILISLWSMFT
ncbi:MAG: hypothetical protein Q8P27_00610 [Candidatus Peregrinibacteria bacterium]|nr:hypothetical protein [Candidatus Peregrinibacteria bacterium]